MNFVSIFLLSTLSWSNPDSTSIVSTPTVENVDTTFSISDSFVFVSDSSLTNIDSKVLISESLVGASAISETCQNEKNLIDSLIYTGKQLIGTPYRYAGNSSNGIDCSGLIHYMFGAVGAEVARTSRDLSRSGYEVDIDQVKKGDLVFFKGRNSKSKNVGHVAIVVEGSGEEMLFLHASSSRGVVIDKISDTTYFRKRLLFAKRLEYEEMFELTEIN